MPSDKRAPSSGENICVRRLDPLFPICGLLSFLAYLSLFNFNFLRKFDSAAIEAPLAERIIPFERETPSYNDCHFNRFVNFIPLFCFFLLVNPGKLDDLPTRHFAYNFCSIPITKVVSENSASAMRLVVDDNLPFE